MSPKQTIASRIQPCDDQAIKIIQITDTHVLNDGESVFENFDTSRSLSAVIDAIKTNEADADIVLLTGDLVHEPSDGAYQRLADHLASLTTPLFYLPGNHDNVTRMDYVLGNNGFDHSNLVVTGNWAIILLDTLVEGEHAGTLSDEELVFLQDCLQQYPRHSILVALHHHPVSINSPWMDAMSLTNADALFAVLDTHANVQGVIWGHIHQAFEQIRDNCLLLGSPSTCLQFKPGSETFAVDNKSPAYRWLILHGDGQIKTGVEYVDYNIENKH